MKLAMSAVAALSIAGPGATGAQAIATVAVDFAVPIERSAADRRIDSPVGGAITIYNISTPAVQAGGRQAMAPAIAASAGKIDALVATVAVATDGTTSVRAAAPGAGLASRNPSRSQSLDAAVAVPDQVGWAAMTIGFGLVGFLGGGRRRASLEGARFGTVRFRRQAITRMAVS